MALETFFRYVGWFLQLAGLGLAAYGITVTRRGWAPDHPSAVTRLRVLLRRLGEALLVRLHIRGPGTPTLTTVRDDLEVGWAVDAATVEVTYPEPPEDATVEDRLLLLEQHVQHLAQRDNDLSRKLSEKIAEAKSAVAAERAARNDEIGRLAQRVRDLAAGGLRLEAVGLLLLFVGVTFGTVPDGISQVVRVLTPLP